MADKVLIVPGYRGSGEAHWQTWLEGKIPNSQRVTGIDWNIPSLPRWTEKVGQAIDASTDPVWLVAHSFGCLASAAAIAQQPRKIAGAILVAPADPERFTAAGVRDGHDPVTQDSISQLLPQQSLNINGLLFASRNDPWLSLDGARDLAKRWQLPLFNAGEAGHINTESGFGPWPFLLGLLQSLLVEAGTGSGKVVNFSHKKRTRALPLMDTTAFAGQQLAYL